MAAPVGGIGAGAIGRAYRGDFARWHLEPGAHRYEPVAADQFSLYLRPLSIWAIEHALGQQARRHADSR